MQAGSEFSEDDYIKIIAAEYAGKNNNPSTMVLKLIMKMVTKLMITISLVLIY